MILEKSLKNKETLGELIVAHDNNYGIDVETGLKTKLEKLPSLSIIIPYFETGEIIKVVIRHLYNSIAEVRKAFPRWDFESIIIDDGSINKKLDNCKTGNFDNLKLIKLKRNKGRTYVRNLGLLSSNKDLCLWILI